MGIDFVAASIATKIVDELLKDMNGRMAYQKIWDSCDDYIQGEIKSGWVSIVRKVVKDKYVLKSEHEKLHEMSGKAKDILGTFQPSQLTEEQRDFWHEFRDFLAPKVDPLE